MIFGLMVICPYQYLSTKTSSTLRPSRLFERQNNTYNFRKGVIMKPLYVTEVIINNKWTSMTYSLSYADAKTEAISLKDTDGCEQVRIVKRTHEVVAY